MGKPGRTGSLTATQRCLWELHHAGARAPSLHLAYAVAIDGPLDRGALAAAFADVIERHEPLRTTYAERAGGVVAEVHGTDLALPGVDLSPRRVADRSEAADAACRERARGFDLRSQAPIRATLLRLSDQAHILMLTLHHIAADGWSLQLLCQQLSAGYAGCARHDPPAAQARGRAECIEHARWQQDWLKGPEAARELRWWTSRLRNTQGPLPMLAARRHGVCSRLRRLVAVVPAGLAGEARACGRAAGASMFAVLLTAFGATVARWSGMTDVVVGTLAANRPTPDSAQIMGAHYNPLLLPTDLAGKPTLRECLFRTAAGTMRALDHQTLPYEILAGQLQRERTWDPRRVPGAMFLMDRYPLAGLKLAGCQVTGLYLDDDDGQPASMPAAGVPALTFFVRETGERLTLSVLYQPGPLDDGAVLSVMGGYIEILTALCRSPDRLLSSLPAPAADRDETRRHVPGDERTAARRTLRDITDISPVEALSPVRVSSSPSPAGH